MAKGKTQQHIFGSEKLDSLMYSSLLFNYGRGYPLRNPRPPVTRESNGVEIGDVGVLTEDGGIFIFRDIKIDAGVLKVIKESCTEKVNTLGIVFQSTGKDMTWFGWHKPEDKGQASSDHKVRANTSSVIVSIGGSTKKIAVLGVPPGSKMVTQRCIKVEGLRDYVSRNYSGWFDSVQAHHKKPESLFLVTGFTKSRSWGNILVNKSNDKQGSVVFRSTIHGESIDISTDPTENSKSFKRGWDHNTNTSDQINQTLFINGLLITPRSFRNLRMRIRDTSKDSDSFGDYLDEDNFPLERHSQYWNQGGGNQGGGGATHTQGSSLTTSPNVASANLKVFNPLAATNEFILRTCPDVEVAITHDDDLKFLLTDMKLAPECTKEEFLQLVAKNYRVSVKEKCGFLERLQKEPNVTLFPNFGHVRVTRPVSTTVSAV